MHSRPRFPILARLGVLTLSISGAAYAGPPFVTDDPETVAFNHWEIDFGTQQYHTADGWFGTAPQLELDYGVIPDVQLHIIAPLAYNRPPGDLSHYGYGDTELGIKYRFVHETDWLPQIGIFPLLEAPTGNRSEGLGNGKTQAFLPVWLQKKFGDWLTYGGGGYWFNPGQDNRNYWYAGWELQRKITEKFAAGFEVQYRTATTIDGHSSVALNAGGMWDLSDTYHILFSAGHTVSGQSEFQGYLALQITFGPEEAKPDSKK